MQNDGKYRIIEMECWDQEAFDMVGPAFIEINGEEGTLHFICVDGWLDVEQKDNRIMFSWEGNNECDAACGAGWAEIDGNVMKGRLFIHNSDHSDFVAERMAPNKSLKGTL